MRSPVLGAVFGESREGAGFRQCQLSARMGREGIFKLWLWVKQFSWFVVGREELPQDPVVHRCAASGRLLHGFLESEDLRSDPVFRPRKKGYLRRIMEQEELPQDLIHFERRGGFFRTLLETETLPKEGDQE